MNKTDRLTTFLSTAAWADYLPHRIFIEDPGSIVVYCNANFASRFGLTPEEIVGHDESITSSPEAFTVLHEETIAGEHR